jgi:hypothetical protein
MKTIKVVRILVITLIIGFISTFATYASSPAAVAAKDIRQKIVKEVWSNNDEENFPSEGTVVVLFTVNDEGKIDIKKLESNNTEAEDFVTKKISGISCKDNVYPYHQFYRVKFQFDQN